MGSVKGNPSLSSPGASAERLFLFPSVFHLYRRWKGAFCCTRGNFFLTADVSSADADNERSIFIIDEYQKRLSKLQNRTFKKQYLSI